MYGNEKVTSQMDKIVIKNPMLFWIVNAVPTKSEGHALADMAENWGESATTAKPHTNKINNFKINIDN